MQYLIKELSMLYKSSWEIYFTKKNIYHTIYSIGNSMNTVSIGRRLII